ncbi:MAG: hypothetical protein ACFNPZ_02885 [Fusobacterium polymorphum]
MKVGEEYFYSDDIKLSEEQFLSLKSYGILFSKSTYDYNPQKASSGIPVLPESGMTSYDNRISTSFGLTPYVGKFWSMARFKFNKNITPSQERAIRNAIQYIESETNVRFYDATNDPDRHPQHGFIYPNIIEKRCFYNKAAFKKSFKELSEKYKENQITTYQNIRGRWYECPKPNI